MTELRKKNLGSGCLAVLLSFHACAFATATPFSATFGPLTISWATPSADNNNVVSIILTPTGVTSGTWYAWGVSTTFGMTTGDVTVCQPALSGAAALSQYVTHEESVSDVVPAVPSPLLGAFGCVAGLPSNFSRPVASGSYGGASALGPGPVKVIWAVGKAGSGTMNAEHETMGMGTINFATGAYSSTTPTTLKAHGVVMFIAWGLLAPCGVLLARYTRAVWPSAAPPFWFRAHWMTQSAALVASIIGFSIGVAAAWGSVPFAHPHTALGLAVFILGLLQPINAFVRPHKPAPGEATTWLRTAWEFAHKGSGIAVLAMSAANIVLGVLYYNGSVALAGAYGVVVAVLLAVAVWREIVGLCCSSRQEPYTALLPDGGVAPPASHAPGAAAAGSPAEATEATALKPRARGSKIATAGFV